MTDPKEKVDPNLTKGIAALVKLCADDADGKIPTDQKIEVYTLGLKAAGVVDKVVGSRKGSKFSR